MYYIMAKLKHGASEVVDETEDYDKAVELAPEYQWAFGKTWDVWISDSPDGPPIKEKEEHV